MRSRPFVALLLAACSMFACTREPARSIRPPVSPLTSTPIMRDAGAPNETVSNGVSAEVDDVREAALRYMFQKNASGAQQRAHVFCIAFADKDPPAAFLSRLDDVHPTVKPSSACDASAAKGVTDKSTGQSGLLFNLDGDIRWTDANHAEIDGGYYEAGLSASGNTYYVERKNGKWVVIRDVMHWIS
jgi:hypothetical protein